MIQSTIFILILATSLNSLAETWKLSSKLKTQAKTDIPYRELTFSLGKKKLIYTPTKPPYGFVYENQQTLNNAQYFIAGAPLGAKNMHYRVFSPALKEAQPVCEVVSDAETTELRINKEVLEISVLKSDDQKNTWIPCKS